MKKSLFKFLLLPALVLSNLPLSVYARTSDTTATTSVTEPLQPSDTSYIEPSTTPEKNDSEINSTTQSSTQLSEEKILSSETPDTSTKDETTDTKSQAAKSTRSTTEPEQTTGFAARSIQSFSITDGSSPLIVGRQYTSQSHVHLSFQYFQQNS